MAPGSERASTRVGSQLCRFECFIRFIPGIARPKVHYNMQHHIQSPRSEGIREGKILTGRPPCRIQVFRHGVHVRIGVRSRSSVRHPAYSCIQRSSPDPGAEGELSRCSLALRAEGQHGVRRAHAWGWLQHATLCNSRHSQPHVHLPTHHAMLRPLLPLPGSNLASQFDRHVLDKGWTAMPRRTPSPLLSPGAVISAQLEALQRNDWPEEGAGVATAFAFTLPASATEAGALDSVRRKLVVLAGAHGLAEWAGAHTLQATLLPQHKACSSLRRHWQSRNRISMATSPQTGAVAVSRWSGERSFVPRPAFEELVRAPPFSVLLGCDSWKVFSKCGGYFPLAHPDAAKSTSLMQSRLKVWGVFTQAHSAFHPPVQVASPVVFPSSRHSDRAVQAVHVQAAGTGRTHTFTFCLVRAGPGSHKVRQDWYAWSDDRVLLSAR